MGICPLVEAADFGPFGGLLGPFWGSSAGAKNRASRACMLNEKIVSSSRRNPRSRHREDTYPREGPHGLRRAWFAPVASAIAGLGRGETSDVGAMFSLI